MTIDFWQNLINESLARQNRGCSAELEQPPKSEATKLRGCSIDGIYFTKREIDCLASIKEHKSYVAVAKNLGLTRSTSECYFFNIRNKLANHNRMNSKQKIIEFAIKYDAVIKNIAGV